VFDQLRDPHRVRDIGLTARHVPQVLGVDHPDREPVLQHVVDRFPVDAGRFHPDQRHLLLGQPVREHFQLPGHRGERACLRTPRATRSRTAHRGHHRVAVHIQASAPLDQHIHPDTPSRRRQGPPGVGNLSIKKLRCALEAAGQGASGSPHHTFLRARSTKKHRRRDRTTAPILIRSRVPAPAGMITFFAKSRSMRSVAFSLRSRSSSTRSGSDRSLSGTRPDSLAFFTHLPNVISWTPILFATSAMDRPESRTRLTAWSLYSWVKFRRVATRLPPLRSATVYDRLSTRSGTVQPSSTPEK